MTTISKGDSPQGAPIPGDLIETLDCWRHSIVLGHVRPDADCLGSMFAVALTWPRADGAPAMVSLPAGSLSRRLAFMAEWADVPVCSPEDFAKADGFVAVDTAKKSRCNVEKSLGETWADGRTLINIDHHTSNTDFGRINWIDAHAGSASELVYRLIRAAKRDITPLVASLLYCGIHADTVGFSLPTTTASALTAAADLVACGARVGEIGELLCRSQDRDEFELYRVIYENTKVVADGRVAYSTASFDEITGAGCTLADIDDQVGIPRSIRGIKIAVLLTEGRKGKTRINIRGEAGISVLDLAQQLGGGGHAQAAGAILSASIEDAVEQVIPKAIKQLDGHDDT